MKKILIINGVNLNLTGKREPAIYGCASFDVFLSQIAKQMDAVSLDYFQSNEEGAIVEKIQQSSDFDGIIINPGAYSHTSIAIADALRSIAVPAIEVHLSNIYNREKFRQQSYIRSCCVGSICGLGINGYRLALEYFLQKS